MPADIGPVSAVCACADTKMYRYARIVFNKTDPMNDACVHTDASVAIADSREMWNSAHLQRSVHNSRNVGV